MSDPRRTIEAVWRIESSRLTARLTRMVRDLGQAEDLAQDALVAALERWPVTGVPDNPGAWLMATAKNRALDQWRRKQRRDEKHQQFGRERGADLEVFHPDFDAPFDDGIEDDLLRMIFFTCHPALSREARVALTLRMVGGLTTEEIARAFLLPVTTVAQRLVRAKRALAEARVPFEVPQGEERKARLSSVLEVIYLIFNEGYAATSGGDWMRPAVCDEALRLGRSLAALIPDEAEVHGLLALMELQASRTRARTDEEGKPVLLLDQNRLVWDRAQIQRGLTALVRADTLGGPRGPYTLQAAISACHARAATPEETDWIRIASLYEVLAGTSPSPVVEINRAVALSMAYGPATGLDLLEQLKDEPAMAGYHLYFSVRGDLLEKCGRHSEAAAEFARAAQLTRNTRERQLLEEREAASRGRTG